MGNTIPTSAWPPFSWSIIRSFWLTGMLPTTAFAGLLLSVFSVVMIFAAVHALIRLFTPRANLLLLLAGELAVVCGSFLYLMQASSSSFYYLPLIAAAGWLAAFTALASLAFLACRPAAGPVSHIRKRVLLFFLCGVSLVMLVLSPAEYGPAGGGLRRAFVSADSH